MISHEEIANELRSSLWHNESMTDEPEWHHPKHPESHTTEQALYQMWHDLGQASFVLIFGFFGVTLLLLFMLVSLARFHG